MTRWGKGTSVVTLAILFVVFGLSKGGFSEEFRTGHEEVKMEEVVVTATKSEEKVPNVPATITVIKGQSLIDAGVRTVGDALQWIPGIHLSDVTGNGTQFWGGMRGMPAHNNRYYLVLVNGIPRNNASDEFWWFTIPLERVERIEIIRGPASALYGRAAMGGVINIITKQGGHERENTLSGTYGSYGEHRVSGHSRGSLSNLYYSVGTAYHESNGWREINNEFYQTNLFGDFRYDISEAISLSVSLDYTNMNRDAPGGVPIERYNAGEREFVKFKESTTYHKEPNAAATLNVMLKPGLEIINRLYFQRVEENWKNHWIVNNKKDDGLRIGDELQIKYDFSLHEIPNQITVGYQFENQDLDIWRQYGKYYWNSSKIGQIYRDADTLRRFNSAYFQDIISIIPDTLTFVGGVRYDHVHIEYDDKVELLDRKVNMDHISPKGGIIFSPVKELSIFANVSTGFRAPIASNIADNPDLKPEKSLTYEVGIRGFLSDRLRYQIVGYTTTIDDMLAYILAKPRNIIANAGEAEAKGIEAEFEAFLPYGFSAFFSYNYNYTKLEEFVDWAGNDWSGKTPPFQPRHKIAGGLTYTNPNGFKGVLTVRWFDDQWITEANDIKMPSYTLVDVKLSYMIRKNLEIFFGVRNLFDEDYISYGDDLGWGEIYLNPGDPRTFFGGITFRF